MAWWAVQSAIVLLAATQIVDVVRNSTLFAGRRATWEAWEGMGGFWEWLAELLLCPYCLLHHAVFWLLLGSNLAVSPPSWWLEPVRWLALVRLAWVLDGWMPSQARLTRYHSILGNQLDGDVPAANAADTAGAD